MRDESMKGLRATRSRQFECTFWIVGQRLLYDLIRPLVGAGFSQLLSILRQVRLHLGRRNQEL